MLSKLFILLRNMYYNRPMTINIFNRSLYKRNFKRITPEVDFLYQLAAEIALENIAMDENILFYGHFPGATVAMNINDYDEESVPPKLSNYDCIASNLSLHFVNNVEKTLADYKSHLNLGGKFIATFLGGNTLIELRKVLLETDLQFFGGAAQRVIPMIDVKDAGRLLQKVGFKDPLSFCEKITVEYPSLLALLRELKNMGQGNFLVSRDRRYLSKEYLKLAEKNYGKVNATFEIITMIGRAK
ncbi:MAG: hypothetical protein ACHP6I_00925 [Rickettsiales bacterium]